MSAPYARARLRSAEDIVSVGHGQCRLRTCRPRTRLPQGAHRRTHIGLSAHRDAATEAAESIPAQRGGVEVLGGTGATLAGDRSIPIRDRPSPSSPRESPRRPLDRAETCEPHRAIRCTLPRDWMLALRGERFALTPRCARLLTLEPGEQALAREADDTGIDESCGDQHGTVSSTPRRLPSMRDATTPGNL
jgi:hypothetical protein